MIPYPNISPDVFSIGPVHVRWYGVMYVIGFIAAYFLIQKQERSKQVGLVGTTAQDLIFYLAIGVIAGGRLGYILSTNIMNLCYYIKHPAGNNSDLALGNVISRRSHRVHYRRVDFCLAEEDALRRHCRLGDCHRPDRAGARAVR